VKAVNRDNRMGFRLRGGRPKNMGQGIYWVQRHLADVRAAERRRLGAQRRVEAHNQKAEKFHQKWHRISANVTGYFMKYANVDAKGSASTRDKITEQIHIYNELKRSVQANIENAPMSDLSRLATAGRACMFLCAKARGQLADYNAGTKTLIIESVEYDFS